MSQGRKCVLIVPFFSERFLAANESECRKCYTFYLEENWIFQIMLKSKYTDLLYPESSESVVYFRCHSSAPIKIMISVLKIMNGMLNLM